MSLINILQNQNNPNGYNRTIIEYTNSNAPNQNDILRQPVFSVQPSPAFTQTNAPETQQIQQIQQTQQISQFQITMYQTKPTYSVQPPPSNVNSSSFNYYDSYFIYKDPSKPPEEQLQYVLSTYPLVPSIPNIAFLSTLIDSSTTETQYTYSDNLILSSDNLKSLSDILNPPNFIRSNQNALLAILNSQ
jgi:hypothetical protein